MAGSVGPRRAAPAGPRPGRGIRAGRRGGLGSRDAEQRVAGGRLGQPLRGQPARPGPPRRWRPRWPRRSPPPRPRPAWRTRRRCRAGRCRRPGRGRRASGTPMAPLAPRISSPSETMVPPKPSSLRSRPTSASGLNVAGSSPVSAGTRMCAVMIGPYAGGDRGLERRQLAPPEQFLGRVDQRQFEVRVELGRAVAREVLGAGGHAGLLQPGDRRHRVGRDPVRVGARSCGYRWPGCRRRC